MQEHTDTAIKQAIEKAGLNKKNLPHAKNPVYFGMASVKMGMRPGEIVFEGLYLPGFDSANKPRNRVAVIGRNVPDWFVRECRMIAENFSDKKVPVRVICPIASSTVIGFAGPSVESIEELNAEWKRYQEDQEKTPKTLADCVGIATAASVIFDEAANISGLRILKKVIRAENSFAIAETSNHTLVKLVGAEQVWSNIQNTAPDTEQEPLGKLIGDFIVQIKVTSLDELNA